jgi:hypothetical protein
MGRRRKLPDDNMSDDAQYADYIYYCAREILPRFEMRLHRLRAWGRRLPLNALLDLLEDAEEDCRLIGVGALVASNPDGWRELHEMRKRNGEMAKVLVERAKSKSD